MSKTKIQTILSSIGLFVLPSRINRTDYFLFFMLWFVILCITVGVVSKVSIFFVILAILSLVNIISLIVKRMHDFNYNSTSILMLFIPLIGQVLGFAFFLIPGTKGKNRFGDQPASLTKPKLIAAIVVLLLLSIVVVTFLFFPALF